MSNEVHHQGHPWAIYELSYITIELKTAFLIATSEGDGLNDTLFVADANGLPCIPGDSLAGVLRHAIAGNADADTDAVCRELFGFQERGNGEASLVRVSFGHVHDSKDKPVSFRGADINDPVLSFLRVGASRDHVRIGADGVAENRGKFDELVVPAGARFTFELAISSRSSYRLAQFLSVLQRPGLRIGKGGRRGLGALKVVRVRSAQIDLTTAKGIETLARIPVRLEKACLSSDLQDVSPSSADAAAQWIHGEVTMRPIGTWMIGGGMATGAEPARGDDRDRGWDRLPLTEGRVLWSTGKNGGQGRVETSKEAPFLIPGSSLKGVLRHRALFHYFRLSHRWLDPDCSNDISHGEPEDFKRLFGACRDDEQGRAGRVYISDAYVSAGAKRQGLQHVSLDRFTQGPMDHLLYDELAVYGGELKLCVSVHDGPDVSQTAKAALHAALEDLMEGRLAVGAGRGHGRFRAEKSTLSWSNKRGLVEEVLA